MRLDYFAERIEMMLKLVRKRSRRNMTGLNDSIERESEP